MGEIFSGRYELVDPIGQGGVGQVWRVWDHRRRRYVAAKVLQQRDAHTLLRFVREQALRIDHPHVLAPATWAADDDKVLFTMELVAGGSLAHLIADYGPLPPRYVCTLIDQLLNGLAAVHGEGVVHRDIKPANILLEATGTARPHLRLSDFGVALRKGEPRLTEANYVMGTPGYFAPEQMLGEEPDFPADLFAVGLVALYLLVGRKPNAEAIIRRFIDQGVPNAPEGVPEPLWQVIAGLLQPDPRVRFRTATGARKAFAEAAELLPEPALDDEAIEVFDQLGPLPDGFGPQGPVLPDGSRPATGAAANSGGTNSGGTNGSRTDGGAAHGGRTNGTGPGQAGEPSAEGSPTPPSPPGTPHPGGPAVPGPPPGPAGPVPGPPGAGPVPGAPEAGAPLPGPGPQPYPSQPQPTDQHEHQSPHQYRHPSPHPGTPLPPPPPAPPLPSMTETGSFQLAPPQPQPQPSRDAPWPPGPPNPGQPVPGQPDPGQPGHTPTPSTSAAPGGPALPDHGQPLPPAPATPPTPTPASPTGYPRTRRYTAPQPQGAHAAPRRPGPPARVVVPVLVLAVLCYAVGVWALLAGG
ncbi:serine/threonine-protein kinase [Streptomyces sp. B1866]|uniref:serine/threonine-protein kinase n=1 Tax=Streptomyces sp. B1866 TaxID=3075431 RepID=UPI00288D314F|nr:serine/threonine-protein kinase [Streptomyces sp. B1866]MDT3395213.1 serine/threonine-protein kinase [Streptomyces sp. B1866]